MNVESLGLHFAPLRCAVGVVEAISENLYREQCETLAGAEIIRRKNIIFKNCSNTLYASHCRGQMVPETFGGQVVAETCEDMVLDDSSRANASFGLFLMNIVERNDHSHSMRAQQIHHSNDQGDCDSNCASDANVDFDRDDNGRQHGLKPFVFSGQLSFSNFDGRRIASPTTADCIRDWTVISDGGKPHTAFQEQNEITAIGPHRRPESPGEQDEETSTHCDAGEGY